MHCHILFSAEEKVGHEFLLASMAMKAVQRMHRPGIRTEETMSQVFAIMAKGHPMKVPVGALHDQAAAPMGAADEPGHMVTARAGMV
jgi:hypothetical protein